MKIPFSLEDNPYNEELLYYGNRRRYSTMTSVVLISSSLLVCASYGFRKLYLVKFNLEDETYEVLDSIDTVGDSEGLVTGPTDLIDYCQETRQLITSNFDQCSISIYSIENQCKLKYLKSIVNNRCGPCHGISYYPDNSNIVFFATTGTTNPYPAAYAINIDQEFPKPFFAVYEMGWLGKDICFMNKNNMFVLYCNNAPNPNEQREYSSKIVLYFVDIYRGAYGKISEIKLENHHSDSCFYKNGKLYVTTQSLEGEGKVVIYNVDKTNGEFVYNSEIPGFNFPHGIDINYNTLAVTEYGNNDVVIKKFLD